MKLVRKITDKLNFWGVGFVLYYLGFVVFFYYFNRGQLSNNISFLILVAWLIFGIIMYFSAYLDMGNAFLNKVGTRNIVYFSIVFNLILLPLFPITSNDLNNYVARGRIIAVHQGNPYVQPFSSFEDDKFFAELKTVWINNTSIYGPFFNLLCSVLAYIGRNNIIFSIYLFKFLFLVSNVATSIAIYLLTKSKKSLFLYAWNPYIIFEFSLNAHNDVLMIFLVVLSFYFLIEARKKKFSELVGLIFLTLSVLIKPFSALLLPFYINTYISRQRSFLEKVKRLVLSLLLVIFVVFCMYLPFWEGVGIFGRIFEISNYTALNSSLLVLLLYGLFKVMGVFDYFFWGRIVSKIVFLIIYILIFIRSLIKSKSGSENRLIYLSMLTIALFLLTSLNWFMPWYWIMLIVFLIISFGVSEKEYYAFCVLAVSIIAASMILVVR